MISHALRRFTVVAIAIAAGWAGTAWAASQVFVPSADTRVEAANPTSAFGTSTSLRTDGGTSQVESLVRFQVTGTAAPVTQATLRLFATSGTADGPRVHQTTSAWSETTTWNGRPAAVGGALDDAGAVAASTWLELDVTALVTGDGTYDLLLAQTSSDGASYHSREGANDPQLVVESGATSTMTLNPAADARVEERAPTTNFGSSSSVRTDGGSGARVESVFRFDLSGVTGAVVDARLHLYARSSTSDGPAVFACDPGFGESSVTWNTRPASIGSAADDRGAFASGAWVSWDVTSLVTGPTLGLLLRQTSTDGASYDSRQGTNRPRLVLTLDLSGNPCGLGCSDGNACTDDTCDAEAGCQHSPNAAACSDGSACTSGDQCAGGACQAGSPVDCDDGDACTLDSCQAATGCVHQPSSAPGCGPSTFQRSYGAGSDDKAQHVVATSDGGALLAGHTGSFGAGGLDFYAVKVDACGTVQWQRTIGGSSSDFANGAVQAKDGGFVLIGDSNSFAGALVVKLDASGNLVWDAGIGGGADEGRAIVQTSDGGYAGITETFSFGPATPEHHNNLIFKLDANGTVQWVHVYGGNVDGDAGFALIEIKGAAGAADGLLVVGGVESWGFGNDDIWLLRLDNGGKLVWSIAYGNTGDDEARAVVQASNGDFVVTGFTRSFGARQSDSFVMRVGSDGGFKWMRRFGGADDEQGNGVVELSDGFAVAGWTENFGAGSDDVFLAKLSTSGTLQWYRTYGGGSADHDKALALAKDGGLLLAGYSYSFDSGVRDMYLVKTDQAGTSGCNGKSISLSSLSQASVTPKKLFFTPTHVLGSGDRSITTKVTAPTGKTLKLCGCE